MTPKMIRSQLAGLVKLDRGRVRRRTSRKHRSLMLVVRTLRPCAWGTAKKLSSSSKSRSRLATARRPPLLRPGTIGAPPGGPLDRCLFPPAGALLLGHLGGDMAQFVRPAARWGNVGENQGQGRRQTGRAVGGDPPPATAFEAALKEVLPEGGPGPVALPRRPPRVIP